MLLLVLVFCPSLCPSSPPQLISEASLVLFVIYDGLVETLFYTRRYEKRSDERKVVSHVRRRYKFCAVGSLQPLLVASLLAASPLSVSPPSPKILLRGRKRIPPKMKATDVAHLTVTNTESTVGI